MQELNGKHTTLDDDAEIYQTGANRIDTRTTKEKWASLDRKGKLRFFRDYYLLKLIVLLCILALVGSIIYTVLKPKPNEVLFIAMIDSALDTQAVDTYFENALVDIGYDSKDDTYTINDDYLSDSSSDSTALSTYLYAGTIDVIIAPEEALDSYLACGATMKLDELPADLAAKLTEEDFFYAKGKDETEEHVYGIRLDNSEFYKTTNTGGYDREYVFITMISEGDPEASYELLRYMFGLPQVNTAN